ncbi:MAG: serine hydrolase domain-containing protein [Vicinamibacterales bacterium]
MAKAWNRTETWLALGVLGMGGLLVAIGGLWVFMSATPPLHPDASAVPSTRGSHADTRWAAAVAEGQRVMREGVAEQNLPGASVAVGHGGAVVWAEGFGWSDLEREEPVSPDTAFPIGTASAAFTSAAVGLLVEQGRLQLDEAIQRDVPGFPAKQWPVTLRQVMGHVAGIRPDAGDEEPVQQHCQDPGDALRRFADRPLLFEPGTAYRYSNYGWMLVSVAVEHASGQPFASFMRQQVFEPLGLDATRLHTGEGPRADDTTYYFPRFAADPRYGPQDPEPMDLSCFSGASGLLSTPSDIVQFVMAINSGGLLRPATVETLQTSQRVASGDETGFGLGWDLETVTLGGTDTRVVGYDGELRGGRLATFLTVPGSGLVVAVTANISHADTTSLALRIAEAFGAAAPSTSPR